MVWILACGTKFTCVYIIQALFSCLLKYMKATKVKECTQNGHRFQQQNVSKEDEHTVPDSLGMQAITLIFKGVSHVKRLSKYKQPPPLEIAILYLARTPVRHLLGLILNTVSSSDITL